jgi:GDP-L-fucose synthase
VQLSRRNSIYENLAIATNVILGIVPHLSAPRPPADVEEELLSGPFDPTNEWYAVTKIAGVKLCQAYRCQYDADFVSVMPTNVFGPGDN